jgi:5-deoxy-glucuronate isomerase
MMRQYSAENLIVHPGGHADPQVILEITPELAGWEYISFQVRRLAAGEEFAGDTGGSELALVLLGGSVDVECSRGSWAGVGGRANVFAGPPHALYLPLHTSYTVRAAGACEVAVASAPAEQDHEPRLVTPADVTLEIRGGDNATRQINGILPPGFPCQRLVVVEVYTPPGSWSSYPPHKHDVHRVAADGTLIEADLEEVYFYKIDRPGGFAYQRVYTDDASPLQRAGLPIDAVMLARDGDAVLVPEGYHPVVSAPGYTTYYLNVLAGSAQSLANVDDPQHTWVKDAYSGRDPRVPIY